MGYLTLVTVWQLYTEAFYLSLSSDKQYFLCIIDLFRAYKRKINRQESIENKATGLSGNDIDMKNAALQSLGKSFLLQIDLILGWLFTNSKRQRIFNNLGKTVVIKLKRRSELNENISY